jgi:hypothetical protein
MKKSLFTTMVILMALTIFQLQAKAGATVSVSSEDEAIVNFDESEIYSSFDQVNDLVSYVSENDAVSYSDVATINNSLVENVSSSAALALNNAGSGTPPFVSAFLWGCVLNWVGIAIVAFTTDMDKEQIMKSVWGCVASTAFWGVFYVIYYVIILGSWSSTIY